MSEEPGGPVVVCTIVARNYLAYARVLVRSLALTNPDLRVVTLVVDGEPDDRAAERVGQVLLVDDLGLAPEMIQPMITMYSVMELSTALKPYLMSHLVAEGADAVAYLDPDIEVYDSLEGVFAAARRSTIALTPHALHPVPRDGREVSERTLMLAGMFNLGFIAVSAAATPFLRWWEERVWTDAVVDFENGLFTDQRWIDWVPALFDVEVLRDPGLNVAYWNAHERPLRADAEGKVWVGDGDDPLRFFHFSGFDPREPWLLSRFMGDNPRVLLSKAPELRDLCAEHARQLEAAGHATLSRTPYRFAALTGGPVLTADVRRLYREAFLGRGPFPAPPTTAVSHPEELRRWLEEPVACLPNGRLAPADLALWAADPALRRDYPTVLGATAIDFARWVDDASDLAERYAELGLRPSAVRRGPGATRLASGWSVVASGYPRPSTSARRVVERLGAELAAAGVPWRVWHFPDSRGAEWTHTGISDPEAWHENVLVCIDAERFSEDWVVQALAGHAGIKVALWLAPPRDHPLGMRLAAGRFDAHWVLREADVALVKGLGVEAVDVVSLGAPDPARADAPTWLPPRAEAPATFLLPLDASTELAQHWPVDAIGAYCEAFASDGPQRLVVLVSGGALTDREAEMLGHAIGDRPDVVVVQSDLDDASLHRAAGRVAGVIAVHPASTYDQVVEDAAAAGVPVVVVSAPPSASYLEGDAPGTEPRALGTVDAGTAVAAPETAEVARALRLAGERVGNAQATARDGRVAVRRRVRDLMLGGRGFLGRLDRLAWLR